MRTKTHTTLGSVIDLDARKQRISPEIDAIIRQIMITEKLTYKGATEAFMQEYIAIANEDSEHMKVIEGQALDGLASVVEILGRCRRLGKAEQQGIVDKETLGHWRQDIERSEPALTRALFQIGWHGMINGIAADERPKYEDEIFEFVRCGLHYGAKDSDFRKLFLTYSQAVFQRIKSGESFAQAHEAIVAKLAQ